MLWAKATVSHALPLSSVPPNFFELEVAAAISLFDRFHSGAALATVVGVLAEVPGDAIGRRRSQSVQGLVRRARLRHSL